jgi:menaquinol-cytochrome c reductase iron-sulfur subunit
VKGVLENQTEGVTRRHAVIAAVYGLWAVIAAALGLPALVYLFFPPKARKQDEWVDAGDISKLTPNAPVEVTFRRNRVDGWKVTSEKSTAWVVKMASGSIVAFGPQCTHLGCAYHWEESKNEFLCPCHASLFAIDGKVVSGPAPRPLDRYQTKIEGNKLELGKLEISKESAG